MINRDDTICHVCGFPGADEADHIVPLAHGGADTVQNMRAIHSEPCHREKTAREARQARAGEPLPDDATAGTGDQLGEPLLGDNST